MRRALLGLIAAAALALASPALAASYYFSDCGYDPNDASTAAFKTGSRCDHVTNAAAGMCKICSGFPKQICTDVACSSVTPGPTASFDDCATASDDAAGTRGNPYCLDPGGDGTLNSFGQLSDGGIGAITTELAAGDIVYLCAGACDGQGSAHFYLQPGAVTGTAPTGSTACTGRNVLLIPRTNSVTVQVYPGEDVWLDGDSNANGKFDSGEMDQFVSTCSSASNKNVGTWDWEGLGFDSLPHLHLIHSRLTMLHFPAASGGAHGEPKDWTLQGLDLSHCGGMWSATTLGAGGCYISGQTGTGCYGIDFNNDEATLTFRRSVFHHLCGFGTRIVTNPSATDIEITDDEFYALQAANNDFQSGHVTYARDYVHDTDQGIEVENDMTNVSITDNLVTCPGAFPAESSGRCVSGISVNDGDTPGCTNCQGHSKGITIARNKVVGNYGSGGPAWTRVGIEFTASCRATYPNGAVCAVNGDCASANCVNLICAPAGWAACTYDGSFLIENNMVADTDAPNIDAGSPTNWAGGANEGFGSQAGIFVNSPNAVTIRNNTVYKGKTAAMSVFGTTNHVILDNAIIDNTNTSDGWPPLLLDAAEVTTNVTYNAIYSEASPTRAIATCTAPTCNTTTGAIACSAVAAMDSSADHNVCLLPIFTNVTGASASWDLHLSPSDTVCYNTGSTASSTDIDNQIRPVGAVADRGADEVAPIRLPPPRPIPER